MTKFLAHVKVTPTIIKLDSTDRYPMKSNKLPGVNWIGSRSLCQRSKTIPSCDSQLFTVSNIFVQ